ncbi:MAG: hypothetical protein QM755_15200 [Luteolibacter sp.]
MKTSLAVFSLIAGLSLSAHAAPPADAAQKIAAALPEQAFAKPAKARKLLVFSVTNGFHHRLHRDRPHGLHRARQEDRCLRDCGQR